MKQSKNVTKKGKVLSEDVSKQPTKNTKKKLNSKSIENKKKVTCSLLDGNKKVKSIKRLKNVGIPDVNVAACKGREKQITKGKSKEKKNDVSITDNKAKKNVQVSSIPKNSENQVQTDKEENVKAKNNAPKINLKRKNPSSEQKSKKSKRDSNTNVKQQQVTATEKNARKKKLQKKITESDDKEEDGIINLKDLSRKHVLQCISAIFHLTQEQLKNKNVLFSGESQPIFMQVTCIRVPKVSRRQVRILLPNSIVLPDDDVALFVCDLERGRRKDYEPTVDHYRELLDKCGCTNIKDVIPMNQVKTEYDQFELKRKLVATYDHFLVDGRIAGHISHLLGKIFYKKRKLPTSIRMDSKDLKREIDCALRKTSMRLHSLADTHIAQVGNTSMEKKHILENVIAICNQLAKVYPGGWSNIRAIRLKTPTGPGLPIYVTLKNKNSVEVPMVKAKRPKAYRNVGGELTTISGDTTVVVTPDGHVIVKQTFPEESEDSQEEENMETE